VEAAVIQGRLILCATPIGNLEDVSERMARVLTEADVIACEDTRRTRKLLTHLGIKARDLVTYNDTNERRRVPELLARLRKGVAVVVVSDAGMPGLSDPGYRLVRACAEEGITVEVVPGPNAAITALAASGLPPGRYSFEGFLPRKKGDRQRRIQEIAADTRTLVFYESPHRIADSLADLLEGLGDRPAALARELTKMHEEIRRGSLAGLVTSSVADPPRGEIVVVVSGAIHEHSPAVSDSELADRARALMAEGVERKEALARVARDSGVPRRRVFDALLGSEE
jgi:16S rRNA (cytidine1402-2'-O)-methyltransferase